MGFRKALWSMEKGRVGLTGSFENLVKNAIMNLQWLTFVLLYAPPPHSNCPKQPWGRNEDGKRLVQLHRTLEFCQAEAINIRQRG